MISEEIDELFEICDEIVVMSQGNISPQISTTKISKDEVGRWMGGLWDHKADDQSASVSGGAV